MKTDEIVLQVKDYQLSDWIEEFSQESELEITIATEETKSVDVDEEHLSYSVEFLDVVNIVIQTVGIIGGGITIYDKIAQIIKKWRDKKASPFLDESHQPRLLINGKIYTLEELATGTISEEEE
jgi:hypothetical protein